MLPQGSKTENLNMEDRLDLQDLDCSRLIDTKNKLMVTRWEGFRSEWGEKGEGIKKHKLVVTKQSQGYRVQYREYSQ